MTQPKTFEDWDQGSVFRRSEDSELPARNSFIEHRVAGPRFAGILRAWSRDKEYEGYDLWSFGEEGSSTPDEEYVIKTDGLLRILTAAHRNVHRSLASVANLPEGTARSKQQVTLDRIIRDEADRLWSNGKFALEEEDTERLKTEFALFLLRYGDAGIRALSRLILGQIPSKQIAWMMLHMLGESSDRNTATARRDILAAALESKDAALRYAAATGLGNLGGAEADRALRKRLNWEKNATVRRMIEAELRK